jgi:hypothetical protein
MEGTEEARAAAKQTRETLKRKREEDASAASTSKPRKSGGPAADVQNESKKACTHMVAIPTGFDVNAIKLDEDVYGTS